MKLSPSEQINFVEGLRNYKVKPISMKYLERTQSPTMNKISHTPHGNQQEDWWI